MKKLIIIIVILSLLPFLVGSVKYDHDVLMFEEYFNIIDNNTIDFTIKAVGIYVDNRTDMTINVSYLTFQVFANDIYIECNGDVLKRYPEGAQKKKIDEYEIRVTDADSQIIPIEKDEWMGYILINHENNSEIYINYDHSGYVKEYRCNIIIKIKEAQKSNFIKVVDNEYLTFNVAPIFSDMRLERIDSVYISVTIPEGYEIFNHYPQKDDRVNSNKAEWTHSKLSNSRLANTVVLFREIETIDTSELGDSLKIIWYKFWNVADKIAILIVIIGFIIGVLKKEKIKEWFRKLKREERKE